MNMKTSKVLGLTLLLLIATAIAAFYMFVRVAIVAQHDEKFCELIGGNYSQGCQAGPGYSCELSLDAANPSCNFKLLGFFGL